MVKGRRGRREREDGKGTKKWKLVAGKKWTKNDAVGNNKLLFDL